MHSIFVRKPYHLLLNEKKIIKINYFSKSFFGKSLIQIFFVILLFSATNPVKRKRGLDDSGSDGDIDQSALASSPNADNNDNSRLTIQDNYNEKDIGNYVGRASQLKIEERKELLQNPWVPPKSYDFLNDAALLKRKFNYAWLDLYSPWLVYSSQLKGALCKHCVLFPPVTGTVKGVLGSFVIKPYQKFKNIHEDCRKHADSQHHKTATIAAADFLKNTPVDIQIQSCHQKTVDENRQILSSIISCILFCGTHDVPLRGKEGNEGVFFDLLNFRIDSGDEKLKRHLEKCSKNAAYISPTIQNQLIGLCGEVIKDGIIIGVKKAGAYAVTADETADVAGKEQLSMGLRFYDEIQEKVREEFIGFVELKAQDASSIAEAIDSFIVNENLPPKNCVGFGFDGCSTMSGKDNGVQAILRRKYPKALFFHCSSHKLNLVVNDANKIAEIRNTVATVKDVINYFRESPARRSSVPNLTKLCETRWSEKYKSIRKFSEHFPAIVEALKNLSEVGNYGTRKSAYQLHSAITRPTFVVAIVIIARYSAVLEPVVNVLQAKSMDLLMVRNHISNILSVIEKDREEVERITEELLEKAQAIAEEIDIEITLPRQALKQKHRSNPPSDTDNEYWRRSLILPYLDSITASLNARFSEKHIPAFALTKLHPSYMLKMSISDFHQTAKLFIEFYALEQITGELDLWYDLWYKKNLTKENLKEIEVIDLFKETDDFYPVTRRALSILIALPPTTATVERSFSTLRRVKTWLRSSMGEERLSGLCLMSVHRKFVKENKERIEKNVLEKFSANPRRLLL